MECNNTYGKNLYTVLSFLVVLTYHHSYCIFIRELVSKLQEEKVDSSLEFLILASDGLWDVVTNEVCNSFSSS